jgi:hypothetical protein
MQPLGIAVGPGAEAVQAGGDVDGAFIAIVPSV